jgi:hypothetical protein
MPVSLMGRMNKIQFSEKFEALGKIPEWVWFFWI